jgi:hypothetical protein
VGDVACDWQWRLSIRFCRLPSPAVPPVSFQLHVGAFGRACVAVDYNVRRCDTTVVARCRYSAVCACAHVRVLATGAVKALLWCTAATGGIYSSACNGRADTCAFALVIGRPPICAAGASWTNRTISAQWAARYGHTTVIDAAGAIYVIGGRDGTTRCKDVWGSTDGGADRTREGGTRRVLAGTRGVLCGTQGYSMVLTGYSGVAARVPRDYLRGTPMVLPGHCTHARGRSSRGALAHSRGYSAGCYLPRGSGGQYYTAGHSMGSSAHSRGFNVVLRGYSRGTLGGHSRGTVGPFCGILGAR